jgi:small subunit ribosomal protein S2
MAETAPIVKELLDSGIHFGHHASRWNPKMKPYIYGVRNGIHIVDIRQTLRGLLQAQRFLGNIVSRGDDVLFVGTKRQAREAVQAAAEKCTMPYVTERWLGGILTNFRTIRSRLQRLEELEALTTGPAWESKYSKKMQSTILRELNKIRRNLEGMRKMTRIPGALVLVDARKETNALREARALGVPTVCLIDTDSDPDLTDLPIPGNDDAMRGISIIFGKLAEAIEEAKKARPERPERHERDDRGEREGGGRGGRRGRRHADVPVGAEEAAVAQPPGGTPAPQGEVVNNG